MNLMEEDAVIDVISSREKSSQIEYLVSGAKAGSSAAFAELREIYAVRVYRQILSITKNREDAEDALQDAFLRAYISLHSFEGRSSFYSWLSRIAINSALIILRKRRARPEISFDRSNEMEEENSVFEVKDLGPNPEQICVHRQRCGRMLRAIRKLQPRLREVIEMQMRQSRSVREIAQALEISEAAVKSRLFRARARLASVRAFGSSGARTHDLTSPIPEERAA
jgi:RNA polymerase sigma-70 factor (ECF subfamily)